MSEIAPFFELEPGEKVVPPHRAFNFAEVTPDCIVPLDALNADTRRVALDLLKWLREYAAASPHRPFVPCDPTDLTREASFMKSVTFLWAAGLARLWVSVDPKDGKKMGIVQAV